MNGTDRPWSYIQAWGAILTLLQHDQEIGGAMEANGSSEDGLQAVEPEEVVRTVVFSSVLGLLILATVLGNVFVISAIVMERNLHGVHNYLIVSLAVADLMVACLVMPLSAVNEVRRAWTLGPVVCDLWTLCDVLSCTASILHLLAIALDRYWAVTRVDYARRRNPRRIYLLILGVWVVSLVVSLAPAFGWKDPDFIRRIEEEKRCLLSQDLAYQIFATFASFYVPLILILILYWRIYKVARSRIRSKGGVKRGGAKAMLILQKENSTSAAEDNNSPSPTPTHGTSERSSSNGMGRLVVLATREKTRLKESTESKRERKAAKTLAIITGVFVFCWLPFFVMALLMPLCSSCAPHGYVFSVLLWLGYTNSMLNPIIYTIFSPDFRRAFQRMLCGARATQNPP